MTKTTVQSLTHFVFDRLSSQDMPQNAFFNYLRAYFEPEEQLTETHINSFLLDSLHHPQWQAQKAVLFQSVGKIIEQFVRSGHGENLRADKIIRLDRLQVITIEDAGELYKLIKTYEQSSLKESENLRVLPDGEEKMITLRLDTQGFLKVRVYGKQVYLHHGALIPLPAEQKVDYQPDLKLVREQQHWMRSSGSTQIRFKVTPLSIKVVFLTGALFKVVENFEIASLSEDKRIFYPLKRLERYYVHRQTDPFYLETLSILERAIEAVRLNVPQAQVIARQAYSIGHEIHDKICPDDKTLYRLLRELTTTSTLKGITLVNQEKKKGQDFEKR